VRAVGDLHKGLNTEGKPPLVCPRLNEAGLHAQSDVPQAEVVGVFLEPDQGLAVQAHLEAIGEAGAEGRLEGEAAFGGVVMGARVGEPELNLEGSHGDGVGAVTDVGPVGLHREAAALRRPPRGRHQPAAGQERRPHPRVTALPRGFFLTPRPPEG
jgi:hypothetical protein